MSLFADILYADGFYGSDEFSSPPGGPVNLSAYQNNIGTVVLYWTLSPFPPPTSLGTFVWTVDTDLVDTFSSPDLRTYVTSDTKLTLDGALVTGNTIFIDVDGFTVSAPFSTDSNTTLAALATAIAARPNVAFASVIDAGSGDDDDRSILVRAVDIETPVVLTSLSITGGASQTTGAVVPGVDFIQGRVHKGVAVPIYERLQGQTRTMYWRVVGRHSAVDTPLSESTFTIPQAIDGVTRDAMLDLMPDPIYKKSPDSNNYKTHWVFGQSLDDHHIVDIFAENDISLDFVRDISLQGKFSDTVKIIRPQTMKAIDFREIIKQFWIEARSSPATRAARNVTRASLAIEPSIVPIRNTTDLNMADDTLGEEVEGFYVTDEDFYQLITFDAALVTGNTYTIDVDGVPVATPFNTDSDTTMQDIADNLVLEPGIGFSAVVKVAGSDNDRVVVVRAANPLTPPVLTNSLVTGGASQANAIPSSAGQVLPGTMWDNIHLAGGVIIEVSNPLGAFVTRRFLEGMLRKLNLANFPLYVSGIS
jgi:hypothetical protein